MLTDEQVQQIRPRLLTIQAIAAALIVEVLFLAGVLSAIVDWENVADRVKMLTLIGMIAGVFIYALSIVVPRVFASGTNLRPPTKVVDQYEIASTASTMMTEVLIRFALINGAIFLNLMVFCIEIHVASLVVAAIGLLLMVAFFPRQSNMISAIGDRLQ